MHAQAPAKQQGEDNEVHEPGQARANRKRACHVLCVYVAIMWRLQTTLTFSPAQAQAKGQDKDNDVNEELGEAFAHM